MGVRRNLACGCCGKQFRRWDNYSRSRSRPRCWCICKECQIDACWDDYLQMSSIIIKVYRALSRANQDIFNSYDRPLQEAIVHQMMEDGVITWGFR